MKTLLAKNVLSNFFIAIALFGFVGTWSKSTLATPSQVLILRHGEKPDDGEDLNAQGRARAQALVGFFQSNAIVNQYGSPVAVYATSAQDDASERPIETIKPTADALGITLNTQFADDDFALLVKDVLNNPAYDGKTVIVCWHHGTIPDMARAFGARNVPKKWQGAVFDRVWVLRFSGGSAVTFTDIPEHVLPGDS